MNNGVGKEMEGTHSWPSNNFESILLNFENREDILALLIFHQNISGCVWSNFLSLFDFF